MRKIYFLLLVAFLFLSNLQSQTLWNDLEWKDKVEVMNRITDLLSEYVRTSTLHEREIDDFKSLFTDDAIVFDDICLSLFVADSSIYNYVDKDLNLYLRDKKLEVYMNDIKRFYGALKLSRISKMHINYDSLSIGKIEVTIDKHITDWYKEENYQEYVGFQFENHDTLLMSITFDNNWEPKIKRISAIASNFSLIKCPYDSDCDNFHDEKEDKCPLEPGSCQGCPCIEVDTLESDISSRNSSNLLITFLGHLGGTYFEIIPPSLTQLDYQNLITGNSSVGSITLSSSMPFLQFGVEGTYLSRNWKGLGLSLGLLYSRLQSNFNVLGYHVEYESTEIDGDPYRRLLTVQRLKEELIADYLLLPLFLTYQSSYEQKNKLGFYFNLGGALSIPVQKKVKAAGLIDYEAIYQYDENFQPIFAANPNNTSTAILEYTRDNYTKKEFQNRRITGLDIALDYPISASQDLEKQISISLILRTGGFYKLNERAAALFGIAFSYNIDNTGVVQSYKLTDKIGDYSSILSASKTNWSTIGLMIGLQYLMN